MERVIVIGGANVDIKGRMSGPALEATSIPGEVVISAGGVARNIAETLARLGVDASLLTALGRDAHAQLVINACSEAGVDMSVVEVVDEPTGVYLAILDQRGEMVMALNDMRAMDALTPAVLERHRRALEDASCIVADCNVPVEALDWLMDLAAKSGRRLVVDPVSVPKSRKLLALKRVEAALAITPNQLQLLELTGTSEPRLASARLHEMGYAVVVAHLGADGVLVSERGASSFHVKAMASTNFEDVTGAGDAAVAGLVFGLCAGLGLEDAARAGQAAAAIKLQTRKSVADAISRDRVLAMAGQSRDH
ncbi:MAG: carbohydrate kinase family protein [Hyphomicrobiales bacterium]